MLSETHSKYVAAFAGNVLTIYWKNCWHNVNKTLLVISVATGGLSIGSFANITGLIVEITSAVLGSICPFSNGIAKEKIKNNKKKEKETQQNCFIFKK